MAESQDQTQAVGSKVQVLPLLLRHLPLFGGCLVLPFSMTWSKYVRLVSVLATALRFYCKLLTDFRLLAVLWHCFAFTAPEQFLPQSTCRFDGWGNRQLGPAVGCDVSCGFFIDALYQVKFIGSFYDE